jgi:hypothetical protein
VWRCGVVSPCVRTFQGLHSVRLWTPTIFYIFLKHFSLNFQTKAPPKDYAFSIAQIFVENATKRRFLFWKLKSIEFLGIIITIGSVWAIFILDKRFICNIPQWIMLGQIPYHVFPTEAYCRYV